jgi:hypothetical protein
MKTFMKKTAAAAVLVLFALFLVTCVEGLPESGGGNDEEVAYVDWEYEEMPDGTAQLTMYLDGTLVPVTATTGRSLGLPLAKMSHDYFEVVFMYGSTPLTVARATWELGQAAGISGVYRSANGALDGVDYRPVAPPGVGANTGASTVFVGRKQTMTLLGVGFLTHINRIAITESGGPPPVPSKYLTTADRSVTFTVKALETTLDVDAANRLATGTSSFLTAAKGLAVGGGTAGYLQVNVDATNSLANLTPLGGTDYPLFELPDYDTHTETGATTTGITLSNGMVVPSGSYKTVAAKYVVGGLTGVTNPHGGAAPGPAANGELITAVRLYDIPEIIKREPRYIAGGQTWYAVASIDFGATSVDLDHIAYAGALGVTPPTPPALLIQADAKDKPISPTIPMTFYLTGASNGIFSIVFSIPVYALTLEPTDTLGNPAASTNGGPPAEIWHITPGYGQNLYNLDSGYDAGGCVLMGINVTSLDWLEIFTNGIGFKH